MEEINMKMLLLHQTKDNIWVCNNKVMSTTHLSSHEIFYP